MVLQKKPSPGSTQVYNRSVNNSRGNKKITKKKAQQSDTPEQSNHLRIFSIISLACVFGILHYFHVSTLFENDRHFSHLSTLEREMTFRSEMGLYYSFFKTIVEAPTFTEGLSEITNNNLTEYPSVINTLERFNLLPEVLLGGMYRTLNWLLNSIGIEAVKCWRVERGHGLKPVLSCEGIQQPEYFYVESVWAISALTPAIIFLYGVFLSGSILGGVMAALCFFFNHDECTRVQWTPPLRESFAYPFCLIQMLCVSICLKANKDTEDSTTPSTIHKLQVTLISITSAVALTLWQFSQFVLATQVLAIIVMFTLSFISRFSALVILMGLVFAVSQTLLLMFGNELLLTSLLTCLLLASIFTLYFIHPVIATSHNKFVRGLLSLAMTAALAIILKTRAFTTNHDAHIINILKSKLGSYRDFHTLLYTCSLEFDFLGWGPLIKLIETGLIPVATFVAVLFLGKLLTSKELSKAFQPHIVYSMIQTVAFTIMALLIMRLKLFFTPHLCILSSLIVSKELLSMFRFEDKHYTTWSVVIIAALLGMSVNGVRNIKAQHSILGEYSNVALEELLVWISENTPKTAVFAGHMPITAAILLSTRRPIVNHPHYEDALLRERTKKVYSIFSRKPPEEIFKALSSLKVDYVVLSENRCFDLGPPGCRMTDLWDIEDTTNKNRPETCPELFIESPFPFNKVFSNDEYAVLRLQQPYVEIKGFNKF